MSTGIYDDDGRRVTDGVETTPIKRLLPYLSPARQAILRAIFSPDGNSRAVRPVIEERFDATGSESSFENTLRVLMSWDLIEEAGGVTRRIETADADATASVAEERAATETVHEDRFALTARGEKLLDEYSDTLAEHAVPRSERTLDEWLQYPVPMEQKFAELVNEVETLRNHVDTDTEPSVG